MTPSPHRPLIMDLSVIRPALIGDWLAKSPTVTYRFQWLVSDFYHVHWGTPDGCHGMHRASPELANEMLRTLRQDDGFTITNTTNCPAVQCV